ncbi:MAG: carbohydrate ABC transporter permease [Faecalibacterium sp.]
MASAAVQNKTPRKVLKKSTRDSLIAYSFIAPNFIGFCVFTLVPMVFAIALAFCAWDGRHAIEFIGLKNFVKLFTTDKIFQAALKNTVVYVIGTVPLTLACSLAMAVLLNQNVKLRNFFRTVAFFPYVASLVAVAAVWNMIFNPSMGPINMILNQFFGVAVENLPRWAAGKDTAMITVILFSVWKNMGYYMVIYLAGLQGCNPDLNEAAELDGANRWQTVLAHHPAAAAPHHLLCGHYAHHLRLQGLRPDVHDHAGRPRYCYHDAGVLHL